MSLARIVTMCLPKRWVDSYESANRSLECSSRLGIFSDIEAPQPQAEPVEREFSVPDDSTSKRVHILVVSSSEEIG